MTVIVVAPCAEYQTGETWRSMRPLRRQACFGVGQREVRHPGIDRGCRSAVAEARVVADRQRHRRQQPAATTPAAGHEPRRRRRRGFVVEQVVDAQVGQRLDLRDDRGSGGTSTMCGMTITWQPAAVAERTPVGESSSATQSRGDTDSARAAARYGSGCGLPRRTSSPTIVAANEPRGSSATIASASRRHDIVTSAHGIFSDAKLCQQIARARPPRDLAAHAGDHTIEQLVDDLVDRQVDTAVFADVASRFQQIAADDGVGVVLAPRAAVGLDEFELAFDPVRLGVDERAVHVPQDGGGSATSAVGPPG